MPGYPAAGPELLVESHGSVRVVTLNRPEAFNAADHALHGRLAHIWSELDADPEVRAIVLTGAGEAFSAGGDLDLLEQMSKDTSLRAEIMADATALALYFRWFSRYMPLEWIAAIPQWAIAFAVVILVVSLNLVSVKVFGEMEFWFSLINIQPTSTPHGRCGVTCDCACGVRPSYPGEGQKAAGLRGERKGARRGTRRLSRDRRRADP